MGSDRNRCRLSELDEVVHRLDNAVDFLAKDNFDGGANVGFEMLSSIQYR